MIYLDYASSTPVRKEVLETFNKVITDYFANPSSIHKEGLESGQLLKRAREQIASFLNVKDNEIIFTSGASESNNFAIKGVAFKYKNRGNHLITSKTEHPSVLNVFKQLENEFGFEVTYLDCNKDGCIDVEILSKYIRDDTILVSLMHVNNETGAITNIDEIGKFIKKNYPKCIFHTDITQSVGKIDVKLDNVDLASMSAHKIYGFKGSGLLVKKEKISLLPLIVGGSQEDGNRAGTSNVAYAVCLAKALRLQMEDKEKDYQNISYLNSYVRENIKGINGVLINSSLNSSPYILNLSISNKKSAIISDYLGSKGISVSNTSACGSKEISSYVIENMYPNTNRSKSSFRISMCKYTTKEDIDELIKVLKTINEDIIG